MTMKRCLKDCSRDNQLTTSWAGKTKENSKWNSSNKYVITSLPCWNGEVSKEVTKIGRLLLMATKKTCKGDMLVLAQTNRCTKCTILAWETLPSTNLSVFSSAAIIMDRRRNTIQALVISLTWSQTKIRKVSSCFRHQRSIRRDLLQLIVCHS